MKKQKNSLKILLLQIRNDAETMIEELLRIRSIQRITGRTIYRVKCVANANFRTKHHRTIRCIIYRWFK